MKYLRLTLIVACLLALSLQAMAQEWKRIAPMHTPRTAFSAFRLPNGHFLVVGGRNEEEALAECETYDPIADTWTRANSMNMPRQAYAATQLQDGRIFVCGGLTDLGTATTNTSEIFDPRTGVWTMDAPMTIRRESHTSLLLPNGRVFIAVGMDGPGPNYNTCEIYDPVAKKCTPAPSLSKPQIASRLYYSKKLGGILFQSGHAGGAAGTWYADMEFLSDAPNSTWEILSTALTPHASTCDQFIQLENESIIAPSGAVGDLNVSSTIEMFDPATKKWSLRGTLAIPRYFGSTVRIAQDSILIIGGYLPNNVNTALDDCTIMRISDAVTSTGPRLNDLRWWHATVTDSSAGCTKIYVFGGHSTRTPNSGYGKTTATCEVLSGANVNTSYRILTPPSAIDSKAGADIKVPITVANATVGKGLDLVVNYDSMSYVYLGSFAANDDPIDVAAASRLGRALISFRPSDVTSDSGMIGYSLFRVKWQEPFCDIVRFTSVAGSYLCSGASVQSQTIVGNYPGCTLSVTIADEASGEYRIRPNPSNGIFSIETSLVTAEMSVIVTDIRGIIVYKDKAYIGADHPLSIDLRTAIPGTYTVVLSGHGTSTAIALVKM